MRHIGIYSENLLGHIFQRFLLIQNLLHVSISFYVGKLHLVKENFESSISILMSYMQSLKRYRFYYLKPVKVTRLKCVRKMSKSGRRGWGNKHTLAGILPSFYDQLAPHSQPYAFDGKIINVVNHELTKNFQRLVFMQHAPEFVT